MSCTIVKIKGGSTFKVDTVDYERLKLGDYKWYIGNGYATTAIHDPIKYVDNKYKTFPWTSGVSATENMAVARMVMGKPPKEGLIVDHINRDRLDNRRENLRWATYAQNGQNKAAKTGLKGVSPEGVKWSARIKNLWLGVFTTEKEAGLVYDKAARHFYGKYAFQNFPDERYDKPIRKLDYEVKTKVRKSRYLGVTYFGHGGKRVKRWRAVYRRKTLGYFLTEYEAHIAYKEARTSYESEHKKDLVERRKTLNAIK